MTTAKQSQIFVLHILVLASIPWGDLYRGSLSVEYIGSTNLLQLQQQSAVLQYPPFVRLRQGSLQLQQGEAFIKECCITSEAMRAVSPSMSRQSILPAMRSTQWMSSQMSTSTGLTDEMCRANPGATISSDWLSVVARQSHDWLPDQRADRHTKLFHV